MIETRRGIRVPDSRTLSAFFVTVPAVAPRVPVLLVIDDEPGIVNLVSRFASGLGFEVHPFTSAADALADLASHPADAALVDLRMPDIGGLDVLRSIREADPHCGVILITAHASIDTAIAAVKLGALDYITKPIDLERLRDLLTSVKDEIDRRAAMLAAENDVARRSALCGMIGRSPAMQELFGLVRRMAPHARTVLITGETGAGKEGIARALKELGPRRSLPLVTVNCSAVVETLFESELFGHVRGAFTGATENKVGLFEAADGGTLFLDEIGELPSAVQAKLLRAIETGEVQRVGSLQSRRADVRVIAATNRNLRVESEAGRFRSDLYFRLSVVELHVPPLSARREDIPYLTAAFVREFARTFGKPIEGLTPGAERSLVERAWPGNVRELRNVLERACMLAESPVLTEQDVAIGSGGDAHRPRQRHRAEVQPLGDDIRDLERERIVQMLAEEHGNKRAVAARLGLSRRTLYRRLERYGLLSSTDAVAAKPDQKL
jgi:two-component system, NtrC family, response regulator HydG